MPAVAFRAISSGSLTFVGSSRTATVTCPSGIQTGDLLLLIGQTAAGNTYSSATAGFTKICEPNDGGSTDVGSGIYAKFATGSDVGGSTVYSMTEGTSGTTSQCNVITCAAYSGVDPSAFPWAWNYTSNNPSAQIGLKHMTTTTAANAQCPTPTSPASIGSSDMAVRVYMSGNDATGTGKTISGSPPSGWTQRGSYITNNSGLFNQATVVVDRLGALDSSTISTNNVSMWDIYTLVLPAVPDVASDFMDFFGV